MKQRVAVLFGGRSGEHEISIRSAKSVMAVLDPERYEVLPYFISQEGKWQPGPILPEPGGNPGIDVVFPLLHGTFGEDGTVQGLLELAALPYVGPGVLASAASMDKDVMKRLCQAHGLPVVESVTLEGGDIQSSSVPPSLAYPLFVKPANLGSSVGISKAKTADELTAALKLASEFDSKVIVERGIQGREFECSVLGNQEPHASLPCEIFPSREFYDYEDKYLLDKARIEMPAKLDAAQTEHLRELAVACYRAMQCEGLARVDFLLEQSSGKLYINELNTIPGFTSISMYPKMWEHSGISFASLIDKLIALAVERHQRREKLRFVR